MSVKQAKHEGVPDVRRMSKSDLTRLNDFWGNIVEVTNDDVKVKGFCVAAKRILTKRIPGFVSRCWHVLRSTVCVCVCVCVLGWGGGGRQFIRYGGLEKETELQERLRITRNPEP